MGKFKFVISVEELKRRRDSLLEIEDYKLGEILLYENGKPVDISSKSIENFDLTGLLNRDFIFTGAYKA